MAHMIDEYLVTLQTHLPAGRKQQARILREVEDHLLESWEHEQQPGMLPEEALKRVLARFGEPAVIGLAFAEQEVVRRVRIARRSLLAGLGLCLLLVCYTLFRYPAIGGTFIAGIGYSLFFVCILSAYGCIGLLTTRLRPLPALPVLHRTMSLSLLGAAMWGGISLIVSLAGALFWLMTTPSQGLNRLAIDHALNTSSFVVAFVIWLIFTLIDSGSAASQTGRISTGSIVGLWSGMLIGLTIALLSLLTGYAFLGFWLHTSWLYDSTCHSAKDLAACEFGDTLGGAASMFLFLPVLGAGLGTIGGLLFKGLRFAPTTRKKVYEIDTHSAG